MHQGQADVDREGELAQGADGVPAVGGHGVADQAHRAKRGQADDPPEDLLDHGQGGGGEVQERAGGVAHLERRDAHGDRDDQYLQDVEAQCGADVPAFGDLGCGTQTQEVRRDDPDEERPPVTGASVVFRRGALSGSGSRAQHGAQHHADDHGDGRGDGKPHDRLPGQARRIGDLGQVGDRGNDGEEDQRDDRRLEQRDVAGAEGGQRDAQTRRGVLRCARCTWPAGQVQGPGPGR